jgi:iron complex outermembrane receptor protein
MIRSLKRITGTAVVLISGICQAVGASGPNIDFRIRAQPLDEALQQFSAQTHIQFILLPSGDSREALWSPGVWGLYSPEPALAALLRGSGMTYAFVDSESVRIVPVKREKDSQALDTKTVEAALPEVLVTGKYSINADIRRGTGDALPRTVIGRDEIEHSSAHSIEELIGQHVPAHLSGGVDSGAGTSLEGRFNLRGLGRNETLVLVDGRRFAAPFVGGSASQPDTSAIPLAAIERIEILPTSASGIYGGGATGGVVNIVLKHDCEDTRVRMEYGSSLSADSRSRGVFLSQCLALDDGRTKLLISGDFSDEAALLAGDRDFVQRGRSRILANNPDFFANGASPPLGALPNILSADGVGLSGPGSATITSLLAGHDDSPGYNLDLADSAQSEGGRRAVLRDGLQKQYLNGTLNHQFSQAMSGFVDVTISQSAARSPASVADYVGLSSAFVSGAAPNNFFHHDVLVAVPAPSADGRAENRLDSRRITAGLNFRSTDSWSFGVEYTSSLWTLKWNQPVGISAAEDIATGRLDVLRDTSVEPLDLTPYLQELYTSPLESSSQVTSVRLGGRLFEWSGGSVMLSALLEHRYELFHGGAESVVGGNVSSPEATAFFPQERRSIGSMYAEVLVPGWPFDDGVPRVELRLAGRIDWYRADTAPPRVEAGSAEGILRARSSFDSANPTIGFQYRLSAGVRLRWSFGTGFRPPSGDELAPPSPRLFPAGIFRDPRRGYESAGAVYVLAGGNPALEPEMSRSRSAGVVLEPVPLPGLHFSLDYVQISKTRDIVSPADLVFSDFSRFEELYPDRVTRGANDGADTFGVGRIMAIDATAHNIAEARVVAWDAMFRYDVPTFRFGTLHVSALATWQPTFETRATPSSPVENEAGVSASAPLQFNGVTTLMFTHRDWTLGWNTRFYDSYRVSRNPIVMENQGARDVPSQTYHDAFVGYHFARHGVASTSIDVQFNVQNVFGTHPPFDAGEPRTGYSSRFGDPRLSTCSISVMARL